MENQDIELLQTKLNVFAVKLSQAYDIEAQYAYRVQKLEEENTQLKEQLSVFEAKED